MTKKVYDLFNLDEIISELNPLVDSSTLEVKEQGMETKLIKRLQRQG